MFTKNGNVFFCHNFIYAFNPETYFTKVVKLYLFLKEMLYKPINMQLFGPKMFISSKPYQCLYSKNVICLEVNLNQGLDEDVTCYR